MTGTDSFPGVDALFDAGLMLLLVCAGFSLISLIVRYRRARGEERLQLRWFTFAAVMLIAPVLVSTIAEGMPQRVDWRLCGRLAWNQPFVAEHRAHFLETRVEARKYEL